MIVELVVVAGVAAGLAAGAGLLGALRARARSKPAAAAVGTLGAAIASRGPRGLRERDVVTIGPEEVLLETGLELDESGLVIRYFKALGIPRVEWVLQLDPAGKDLVLGRTTNEVPAGAVPEALPIEGRMLRLRRRGLASVRATGSARAPFGHARFTILEERGGRVLVVLDPHPGGERFAIVGERLDPRGFDVLPGGDVPE